MARIRTLKPSVWRDKAFCSVSRDARLLFIGLISNADDEGRFEADPELLRAAIYPRDGFGATPDTQLFGSAGDADVDVWLAELESVDLVRLWTVRGERFGDLPGWLNHQRIQRPTPSVIPDIARQSRNVPENDSPTLFPGDSDTSPRGLREASVTEGDKEKERVSVVGANAPPTSSSRRSTVRQSDGLRVWEAYAAHHPRAVLTPKRRSLIRQRIAEGYTPDRLVAAIHGNHVDAFANGDNDRRTSYHDLELILRDAARIERYEETWLASQNGGGRDGAQAKIVRKAVDHFSSIEAGGGRGEAEEWLRNVHSPDVVNRVLEETR